MKNMSAESIARFILSLPKKIRELPIKYEDCDCGNDPHPMNGVFPKCGANGSIYLVPATSTLKEVIDEFKKLASIQYTTFRKVEKAVKLGEDIRDFNTPPLGWDCCRIKQRIMMVSQTFDPNKEEYANWIKEEFKPELLKHLYSRYTSKHVNWFWVGYPGKAQTMQYELESLDISMAIRDVQITPEEFPHDSYINLSVIFKVIFRYKPDLDYKLWNHFKPKYNITENFLFEDKLTFVFVREPSHAHTNN